MPLPRPSIALPVLPYDRSYPPAPRASVTDIFVNIVESIVIQAFDGQRADVAAGRADAALADALLQEQNEGGVGGAPPTPLPSPRRARNGEPPPAGDAAATAAVPGPHRLPAAALQRRIAERWQRQLFSDLAGAVRGSGGGGGGGDGDDDGGFLTSRPRVFRVPGAELRLLEVALRAQEDALGAALAGAFDDEGGDEDADETPRPWSPSSPAPTEPAVSSRAAAAAAPSPEPPSLPASDRSPRVGADISSGGGSGSGASPLPSRGGGGRGAPLDRRKAWLDAAAGSDSAVPAEDTEGGRMPGLLLPADPTPSPPCFGPV